MISSKRVRNDDTDVSFDSGTLSIVRKDRHGRIQWYKTGCCVLAAYFFLHQMPDGNNDDVCVCVVMGDETCIPAVAGSTIPITQHLKLAGVLQGMRAEWSTESAEA